MSFPYSEKFMQPDPGDSYLINARVLDARDIIRFGPLKGDLESKFVAVERERFRNAAYDKQRRDAANFCFRHIRFAIKALVFPSCRQRRQTIKPRNERSEWNPKWGPLPWSDAEGVVQNFVLFVAFRDGLSRFTGPRVPLSLHARL